MSVLIINSQLEYIQHKDVGVKVDGIVAIPFSRNPDAFDQFLRNLPAVEGFAYSQRLPVNNINYDGRIVRIDGKQDPIPVESCFITSDFLDLYDIPLISGRNINSEALADSNRFVINETALRTFGWTAENAIGQRIQWSGAIDGEVVGVVKDFHLESVHQKIPPMIMLAGVYKSSFYRTYISIRLSQVDEGTLQKIKLRWEELNPAEAFVPISMPESFDIMHSGDKKFGRVIFYFTIIAILISVMGVYSIAAYSAEAKRKEIGIRKLLGSSTLGLTVKLSAPFLLVATIAVVLASPIVAYYMTDWLSGFAYHTSMNIWLFFIGASIVIVLTLVAILKETLGAALINPIKYLRDE